MSTERMKLRLPWGRYSILGMNSSVAPTAKPVSNTMTARRVAQERRQASTSAMMTPAMERPTALRGRRARSSKPETSLSPAAAARRSRRAWAKPKSLAASMGITDTDTNSDNVTEQVTAMAMSLKSCPASSWVKTTGRNTATVVSVEASTAPQTSRAPS